MRFLRLLFISNKSSVLSMLICNMLAVTQDLMSMRHFGCYWWLGVMISHCLAWRPSAAIRHEDEYGNLVAIAPSGVVYRVNNIGPSTKPWSTLKHRFRYDDRVPLITTDCFHRLKQDPNQSNAASLIANLCSRCSSMCRLPEEDHCVLWAELFQCCEFVYMHSALCTLRLETGWKF